MIASQPTSTVHADSEMYLRTDSGINIPADLKILQLRLFELYALALYGHSSYS